MPEPTGRLPSARFSTPRGEAVVAVDMDKGDWANDLQGDRPTSSLSTNSSPKANKAAPTALSAEDRAAMEFGEGYRRILEAIGEPGYHSMKALFYGEEGPPASTIPPITVSFELFDAVQNRFANTKMMLERTKTDLHTRHQQYAVLQEQYEQLQVSNGILEKRVDELERNNTQLHQNIAKQEVTADQLRQQITRSKVELEMVEEKMAKHEEELQVLHHRVAEGLVLLSQKETIITNLRRQLGRGDRSKFGHAIGVANGESDEYSADILKCITDDVEGRSVETQLRLYAMELEAKIRSVEEEKKYIMLRHTLYRKHVQSVTEAYEMYCMLREDAMLAHVCEVPRSPPTRDAGPLSVSKNGDVVGTNSPCGSPCGSSRRSSTSTSHEKFPLLFVRDIQVKVNPDERAVESRDSMRSATSLLSPDGHSVKKARSRLSGSHVQSSGRRRSTHHRSNKEEFLSTSQQSPHRADGSQTLSPNHSKGVSHLSKQGAKRASKRSAEKESNDRLSTGSSLATQITSQRGSTTALYDNIDAESPERVGPTDGHSSRHTLKPSSPNHPIFNFGGQKSLQRDSTEVAQPPSMNRNVIATEGRGAPSPFSSPPSAQRMRKAGSEARNPSPPHSRGMSLSAFRGLYSPDLEAEVGISSGAVSVVSDACSLQHVTKKRGVATKNRFVPIEYVRTLSKNYSILHDILLGIDEAFRPLKEQEGAGTLTPAVFYLYENDEDMSTQMEHMTMVVMDDVRLAERLLHRIQRGISPVLKRKRRSKTFISFGAKSGGLHTNTSSRSEGKFGVPVSSANSCISSMEVPKSGTNVHDSNGSVSIGSSRLKPTKHRVSVTSVRFEDGTSNSVAGLEDNDVEEVLGSSLDQDTYGFSQPSMGTDAEVLGEGGGEFQSRTLLLPEAGPVSDAVVRVDGRGKILPTAVPKRTNRGAYTGRRVPRPPSREGGYRPLEGAAKTGGVSRRVSSRFVEGGAPMNSRIIFHTKKVEPTADFPETHSRVNSVIKIQTVGSAGDKAVPKAPVLPSLGTGSGHTTHRMAGRTKGVPQRTPWNPALVRLDLGTPDVQSSTKEKSPPCPSSKGLTLPWTAFFHRTLARVDAPEVFLEPAEDVIEDASDNDVGAGGGGIGAGQFITQQSNCPPFGWANSVPLSQTVFQGAMMQRNDYLTLGGTALTVPVSRQPVVSPRSTLPPMSSPISRCMERQGSPPETFHPRGNTDVNSAVFSVAGCEHAPQRQHQQQHQQQQHQQHHQQQGRQLVKEEINATREPELFFRPTNTDVIAHILRSGPVQVQSRMRRGVRPRCLPIYRPFVLQRNNLFVGEKTGSGRATIDYSALHRRPKWASLYLFHSHCRKPSTNLCINSRKSDMVPSIRRRTRLARRSPRCTSFVKRWLPMKVSRPTQSVEKEFVSMNIQSMSI